MAWKTWSARSSSRARTHRSTVSWTGGGTGLAPEQACEWGSEVFSLVERHAVPMCLPRPFFGCDSEDAWAVSAQQ